MVAFCLLLAFTGVGAGCGRGAAAARGEPGARVLRVAVASNMRLAFPEVAAAFAREHADVLVEPVYGSTGNFVSQISSGAPFDVFLAADEAGPERLVEEGYGVAGSVVRYASGRLALWVRGDSPIDVTAGYAALTHPSVRKISIANPKVAPYGVAAQEALGSAGVLERVRGRLVLGENSAQTLQFVDSGGAQIGIVALSLARAPELDGKGRYWEVPAGDHAPIVQAGCVVSRPANPPSPGNAEAFMAFLCSEGAREVLRRHGFGIPGEGREGE